MEEEEDVLKLLIDDNVSDFDIDEDAERELLREDDHDVKQKNENAEQAEEERSTDDNNPESTTNIKDDQQPESKQKDHDPGFCENVNYKLTKNTQRSNYNNNNHNRFNKRRNDGGGGTHGNWKNKKNKQDSYYSERKTLLPNGPNPTTPILFNNNKNNSSNFISNPGFPTLRPIILPSPMNNNNNNGFMDFQNQRLPPPSPSPAVPLLTTMQNNNFSTKNYNLTPMNVQMNAPLNLSMNAFKQPLLSTFPPQPNNLNQPSFQPPFQPNLGFKQGTTLQFPPHLNQPIPFSPLLQFQQNSMPILNSNILQPTVNAPQNIFMHNQSSTNLNLRPLKQMNQRPNSSNRSLNGQPQGNSNFAVRCNPTLRNGPRKPMNNSTSPAMSTNNNILPVQNNNNVQINTQNKSHNGNKNKPIYVSQNGGTPKNGNAANNNANNAQTTQKKLNETLAKAEAQVDKIKKELGISEEYMKEMEKLEKLREELQKLKATKRKRMAEALNNNKKPASQPEPTVNTKTLTLPTSTTPTSVVSQQQKIPKVLAQNPSPTIANKAPFAKPPMVNPNPLKKVNVVNVLSQRNPKQPINRPLSKKVKIIGLDPKTRESAIRKIARPCGIATIAFLTEPNGARSAFVSFEEPSQAQKFMETYQNQQIDSCPITITYVNWFVPFPLPTVPYPRFLIVP